MTPQRTPLIAGNWKMHCTRAEAEALVTGLKVSVSEVTDREVLVAPPFTALEVAAKAIKGSPILLAAQDMHWEPKGAFTGAVAPGMLKDVGCTHVIIGHSERRQFFAETDETVNKKVEAAFVNGLVPIMCVGELLAEREAGKTIEVLDRQVRNGLKGRDAVDIQRLVVAYEPVWAIGTGKVATPEQAQEAHAYIRHVIKEMFGHPASGACRILYGGSVKPDNVDELMSEQDIDGALVGGASLQVESFARIVRFEA